MTRRDAHEPQEDWPVRIDPATFRPPTAAGGNGSAPAGPAPMRLVSWLSTDRQALGPGGDPARQPLAGPLPAAPDAPFDFGVLDANGDGVLSGTELGALPEAVRQAADADRSGEITRAELAAVRPVAPPRPGVVGPTPVPGPVPMPAPIPSPAPFAPPPANPLAGPTPIGPGPVAPPPPIPAPAPLPVPVAPPPPLAPAAPPPPPPPLPPTPLAPPVPYTPALPTPFAPTPPAPVAPGPAPYAPPPAPYTPPTPDPAPYAPAPYTPPTPYAPVGPAPDPAPYAPPTPAPYAPPTPAPYAPPTPAPYTPPTPAPYTPPSPAPYAPPAPDPAPYVPPTPVSPAPAPYVPPPAYVPTPAPTPAAYVPPPAPTPAPYQPSPTPYIPPPAPGPSPAPYTPPPAPYIPPPAPAPSPTPAPVGPQPVPGVVVPASPQAASMRQAMEKVLTRRTSGQSFGRIERDLSDSNFRSATRNQAGKEILDANRAAEAEQLAKLPPEHQAAYQRVAAAVEGEPMARAALALLLAEGTLTNMPAAADGHGLLAQLDRMAAQPTAGGIDRNDLLEHIVYELALPASINQKNRGTCTMASVQILAAMRHPAEYVRIVAGLASPEGKATLAGGATIERKQGTEREDGTSRSISSRLWQPAMMELGNGRATYNNRTDRHSTGGRGLGPDDMDMVMEQVWNRKTNTYYRGGAIMAKIEQATNAGLPVPICMDGHAVLVTRVTADRVYLHNPWGTEDSFSRSYFARAVVGANVLTDEPAPKRGR